MKTTVSVVFQGMCERIAEVVVEAPDDMSYDDICSLLKDELESRDHGMTDGEWDLISGFDDVIVGELDCDHDEQVQPQVMITPDNNVTFLYEG